LPADRRPEFEVVNNGEPDWSLYEVDLVGQEVRRLGTAGGVGQSVEVTRSLLARPMVAGVRPPDPLDPRLRNAGIAAGGALLVGAGVLWLRRRRTHG
jgi:LPXTG-motif cell wall-anchored protein